MTAYGIKGKQAASELALLSSMAKNHILTAMADALCAQMPAILEANGEDLALAKSRQLSPALTERLTLSPEKIQAMAAGILDAAALPDPIGEVIERFITADNLHVSKIRVPLGLLMMIYESRPNVTADAAALAVKSGNAIILKGGKEALHTNGRIAEILIAAAQAAGLPEGGIQFIASGDRSITNALMADTAHVDAIIPRGGPALKKAILEAAKVPVLMTGAGVCHLYVGASADAGMATAIALNAKTQRPGVCNAIETLLLHEAFPQKAELLSALMAAGVHLRVCPDTRALLDGQPELKAAFHQSEISDSPGYSPAEEADFGEEYLSLKLSVKLVFDVEAAVSHIRRYSTGHSEAIVTEDLTEAEHFLNAVDAACVYHNASTRFTDGGCFGFGCEIGIATQKLHARGPMGLRELTGYKYQLRGSGQTRK